MSDYKSAIAKTLQWEGGYSNDPADRGGITYRGISRKYHPNWQGWAVVDRVKPKRNAIIPELEDDVILFYKKNYWDKIRLDEVCNDSIAGFVFDWYVNSGNSGIKSLQRALGLQDDGIVGAKTIHAINNTDMAMLKTARTNFFKSIARTNPSQERFLKGWLNRVNSF
jgi:lysozyme family protein